MIRLASINMNQSQTQSGYSIIVVCSPVPGITVSSLGFLTHIMLGPVTMIILAMPKT